MCGIAGVHCWGDERPTPDVVRGLLLANEVRGKDASGVAWLSPKSGEIQIKKDRLAPTALNKAISDSEWQEIASSKTVLLHARAKTKGDAAKNENNHPVYAQPYKWIVTHNGNVRNDDDLWYKLGKDTKRFADVDTSALPLVLSQSDEYLPYLSLVAGNATFAAWNEYDKGHPVIARFGEHELFLFLDQENGILMWSSSMLATDVVPAVGLNKLRFVTISRLPEDRVMVLGAQPEHTKIYHVKRSPFFLPKVVSGGSTTPRSTPYTGRSTGGGKHSSVEAPRGSKRPTFRWERPSVPDADMRTRPHPLWDRVMFAPMELTSMHGEYNRTPGLTSSTLHTPYGRWVFHRTKDTVEREFLPHKRWKKFLRFKFNEHEEKLYPDMPVTLLYHNDKSLTPWDNLLSLEGLMVEMQVGTAKTTLLYHMCPWCGVFNHSRQWLAHHLRCDFCNIRSSVGAINTVKGVK